MLQTWGQGTNFYVKWWGRNSSYSSGQAPVCIMCYKSRRTFKKKLKSYVKTCTVINVWNKKGPYFKYPKSKQGPSNIVLQGSQGPANISVYLLYHIHIAILFQSMRPCDFFFLFWGLTVMDQGGPGCVPVFATRVYIASTGENQWDCRNGL